MIVNYDLVIKNGTVVLGDRVETTDIGVNRDKIAAIGMNLTGKKEIDATGKIVTPGAIDIHVHLQTPVGTVTSSDDFYDGTRAAVFGGTTTIVDFVEPEPDESMIQALEVRRAEADPKVVIDYGLHMTIGPDEIGKLDQIPEVFKAGTRGFKMYMAYDLCLDDGQMLQALEAVRDVGGQPVVHAENWNIIQKLTERNIHARRTGPRWHPVSRPALFEGEAVNRVIALAEYAGVPVHIFHISCSHAVEVLAAARRRGLPVTGETCPQYLFLTGELHERDGVEGALPVCSPPLRNKKDQDYLWKALSAGDLQLVSTDHCPFTEEEKKAGMDRFDHIPGGVPSIEMRFSGLYSKGVKSGLLTLSQWVDLCCTAPAELMGYKGKGKIAIGYDADLVVFDPDNEINIGTDILHETAGWTPYEGLKVSGWPAVVLCRGEVVVENGNFYGNAGQGRFINPNV